MNTNTAPLTDGMSDDSTTPDEEDTTQITYEKGSWQDSLQKSSNLLARSVKNRKSASTMLWKGAKDGIEAWLPESATDVSAEGLYQSVIEALGKDRKGDASKIKTVAVAARVHSLDVTTYPNLSKAYAAARDLTVGEEQRNTEDSAVEKAIEGIEVPKSATSTDGAAKILLAKGVDGAVVALLDALGANNFDAHRAFARAMATEIASRVQAAKPKPTPKAKPEGAKAAKKTTAKKAAAPIATKKKGKPATKGKPAAKASVEAPAEAGDNAVETPAVATKVVSKGKPVVKRPRQG